MAKSQFTAAQKQFEQAWARFNKEVSENPLFVERSRLEVSRTIRNGFTPCGVIAEIPKTINVYTSYFWDKTDIGTINVPQYLIEANTALINAVNQNKLNQRRQMA